MKSNLSRLACLTVLATLTLSGDAVAQTSWSQSAPPLEPAPKAKAVTKPGQPSAPKAATPVTAGGSAVVVYTTCGLLGNLGPTAEVKIDKKVAGEVPTCSVRRFPAAAGEREISISQAGFRLFDFGFDGPKYKIEPGKPLYIRAHFYKYFEQTVVPADQAKAQINAMSK